jgi:hypothetical protein
MSYHAWLYVYANPVNLADPSGHDPWWCENQTNPNLCYAQWIIGHGGRPTSEILKVYYDWSPNEALHLLQAHFKIKIPSGIEHQFANSGVGEFSDYSIFGANPWFVLKNTQTAAYTHT